MLPHLRPQQLFTGASRIAFRSAGETFLDKETARSWNKRWPSVSGSNGRREAQRSYRRALAGAAEERFFQRGNSSSSLEKQAGVELA
ncbi:hypothetical protein [Paenibacillus roseus]|uniref:hypothetical protein n=1 Tax=Paenibacillus sp. GCM10012307 TaxID=3317343 RepID=UPI0036D3E7F5